MELTFSVVKTIDNFKALIRFEFQIVGPYTHSFILRFEPSNHITFVTFINCPLLWQYGCLVYVVHSSFAGLEYISGRDNELQKFSFTAALILVEEPADSIGD